MSELLVVGSVALDTVDTPFGTRQSILGGAATHFSMSARHFASLRLVGVVGKDFPTAHIDRFKQHGIDIAGLEIRDGETFRWHGKYEGTMDSAQTLRVDLNVFGEFRPTLPDNFRESKFAHLGTAAPEAQGFVLDQLENPEFVMLDTIEFWIQNDRKGLLDLLPRVNAVCINHEEAMLLADKKNLASAMRELTRLGLKNLIVKRSEHGATLVNPDFIFSIPSFPTEEVVDPTGAGDAFAGGVLGHIASHGTRPSDLRRALAYGSVMGSFAVEGFGTEGLDSVNRDSLENRVKALIQMITL